MAKTLLERLDEALCKVVQAGAESQTAGAAYCGAARQVTRDARVARKSFTPAQPLPAVVIDDSEREPTLRFVRDDKAKS